MAVSGCILFLFVVAHLIGNLQIYAGPEKLNRYAVLLRSDAGAAVGGADWFCSRWCCCTSGRPFNWRRATSARGRWDIG
jgi:hypothetical protein